MGMIPSRVCGSRNSKWAMAQNVVRNFAADFKGQEFIPPIRAAAEHDHSALAISRELQELVNQAIAKKGMASAIQYPILLMIHHHLKRT